MAALVSVAIVAIFSSGIKQDPVYWLDITWRLCIGVGAIPGMVGIYYRLKVPESPRYTANVIGDSDKAAHDLQHVQSDSGEDVELDKNEKPTARPERINPASQQSFGEYFAQWKNFRVLLGTAGAWFALDVGFYGTNLNTPTILGIIGFGKGIIYIYIAGVTVFDKVWNQCVGNLVISLLGSVPGYWVTVFLIERCKYLN